MMMMTEILLNGFIDCNCFFFAVMRLGKKKEKEKELEAKSQVVEGINRLVCQAKTHHSLLKG